MNPESRGSSKNPWDFQKIKKNPDGQKTVKTEKFFEVFRDFLLPGSGFGIPKKSHFKANSDSL